MKVRPPHLRVIPGGRYRLHEIPRSLAGRPAMPDQIREHSGGLLGDAVALGVLVFCGLTMPLWKAYRRVRYGEKFA